jgi:hypothetical protein
MITTVSIIHIQLTTPELQNMILKLLARTKIIQETPIYPTRITRLPYQYFIKTSGDYIIK